MKYDLVCNFMWEWILARKIDGRETSIERANNQRGRAANNEFDDINNYKIPLLFDVDFLLFNYFALAIITVFTCSARASSWFNDDHKQKNLGKIGFNNKQKTDENRSLSA